MPSDTPKRPLRDLCDADRGITYGIVKIGQFVPDGVRVVRGGDIRNGRIIVDDTKRVTKEVSEQFKRTILRGGEIVINLIAEPGHTAIVPSSLAGANVTRDVAVVPINGTVDHRYVDYCLKSRYAVEWLTSRLQGSVTQKIDLGTLAELPIPIPPIGHQRAIACILGTLDDKIELNRRMSETLEAMARALFKSWFVDFDPVRAKAEGRDPGLPKEFADLFPDRFVESELGEIPEGWSVSTVEDLSLRVGMGPFGSNIKVSTFVEHGIPVISGQHLNDTTLTDSTFNFVTLEHADRLAGANVARGDIVFTHARNIGQVAYIPDKSQYERYVLSQRQFFLRCDVGQISPILVTYFFKSPAGQHKLLANASQVGVPSIARPVSYLRSIQLVVPPKLLSDKFDSIVRVIHHRVSSSRAEANTLTQLRDTLLPKLISGELRVKDASETASVAA